MWGWGCGLLLLLVLLWAVAVGVGAVEQQLCADDVVEVEAGRLQHLPSPRLHKHQPRGRSPLVTLTQHRVAEVWEGGRPRTMLRRIDALCTVSPPLSAASAPPSSAERNSVPPTNAPGLKPSGCSV